MEKEQTGVLKHNVLTLPLLAICGFVFLAFLFHLFADELSATAYGLILVFLATVFAVSKPIVRKGLPRLYLFIWIAALAVPVIHYLFRCPSKVLLIDGGVLICGFILITCFSTEPDHYTAAVKVIKGMAFFFCVGALVQGLIPSLYRIIISVFPVNLQNSMRTGLSKGIVEGFTTNPGFAAGYITAGVFAVYALTNQNKHEGKRAFIEVLILILSLLLVGKRGPFLFMIITLLIVRILPERGSKWLNRLWIALMVLLAVVVLFFIFQDALSQIPLFRRVILSVQGFLSGEDISSGRMKLTKWAVQLFRENPLTGIGWSQYKLTTAGNATLTKYLDTHNVYLQLLCETGIIGFSFFALVFVLSWNLAQKGYCACIRSNDEKLRKWLPAMTFSLSFQTYFLLYSLSGNPLYDQFYQILYGVSCSIAVAYNYVSKGRYKQVNQLSDSAGEVD